MRRIAKTGLLTGCATGALVFVSASASAQSFNGTPNAVVGSPSITTDPGDGATVLPSTLVSLGDSETVINWTVNTAGNASAVFQPENTNAVFFGDDLSDFTVLNRIIPVDAATGAVSQSTVQINGNVIGFVNPPGNQPGIGGQVWFYSPTGIIVGSTAQFNVGSLLLTTHDVGYEPDVPSGPPGFILGPGGALSFNAATDPASFVQVQPGAQITATGNPQAGVAAYVALVSPRIEQGGNISADGSISYLAADQLDMTINAGLVDFELTVGTADGNGIVHTGTTTGPASASAADRQVIAMVALPRNDALTMLLSGTIGYTAAASAAQEGSTVVLSSGFSNAAPTQAPDSPVGSIEVTNSAFLNDVTAFAAESIVVAPASGLVDFQGDATLVAGQLVDLTAETQEEIRVAGQLGISAGIADGGEINIAATANTGAPGGQINVVGNLTANAGSSPYLFTANPPLDTEGGNVFILADGGTIGAANIYADVSAFGTSDTVSGGSGRGGFISATVQNDGAISAGTFSLSATGFGGSSETVAGDGYGGTIFVEEFNGQFDVSLMSLEARGFGGGGDTGLAGNATGGIADITLTEQEQSWDSLDIVTTSYAGAAFSGGPGNFSGSVIDGGEGGLHISGTAALSIDGDVSIRSDAISALDGVPGFFGQAGDASIDVIDGGSLDVLGSVFVSASALFNSDLQSSSANSSPTQTGGAVRISADGGNIAAGNLTANANANGLSGQTVAGDAFGGTVTVSALAGGSINIDNGSTESSVILSATGYGSPGPIPSNATGGTTRLIVDDATFAVNGNLDVWADGRIGEFFDPPPTGDGFAATGGTASIELLAGSLGTASLTAGTLNVSAVGDARVVLDGGGSTLPGGDPIVGNGGNGNGGFATFTQAAGTVLASDILITSNAFGGASAFSDGASAFQSGNAEGGTSRFDADGGTASFTSINIQAGAIGGGGAPDAPDGTLAAFAGDATGGTAELSLVDGTINSGPLQINAAAIGGAGMGHASTGAPGAGGAGSGGSALLTLHGGSGDINVNSALMAATGTGGTGGNSGAGTAREGGAGSGGLASAGIADGQFSLGTVVASADGVGGAGGTGGTANGAGGAGSGGTAEFSLVDVTGPTGARSIGNLGLYANGTAGAGSGPAPSTVAGTVSLVSDAFDATSGLTINGLFVAQSRGTTAPAGAGFTATITNAPFTVAAAAGIETSRDILITANAPLVVNGQFVASGRSFTETGLLQAGSVGIVAAQFIDAGQIASNDTTGLFALGGAIAVDDLNSVGMVTAQGQSIDISSTGSLNFEIAQATAGSLSVSTAGNLTIPVALAAGAMTLDSGGLLSSGSGLSAGGNFSGTGSQGVNLTTVSSGGTTSLRSTAGDVDVLALVSGGTVSVSGINVDLAGPGPLTFTSAQAENALSIATAADSLAFGSVNAGGAVTLLSGGTLTTSGSVTGGATTLAAADDIDIGGDLSATGALVVSTPGSFAVAGDASAASVDATAADGISLGGLASEGATSLVTANGPLAVTDLTSAGAVTARGQSVNIGSTGALSFADLDATAGPLTLRTAGNLQVSTVDATGAVILNSSGGSFSASGAINSGGPLAISGQSGLTAGQVRSGGSTSLQSADGAISVSALTSPGAVTASGRSISISSPGALDIASATATAGPLSVVTANNLNVSNASSTGLMTLRSASGTVTSVGTLNAGNGAIVNGAGGVTLGAMNSGGTVQLASSAGDVAVRTLASTGPVSVTGANVNIGGSGPLTFTTAQASTNLSILTDGNLAFSTVMAGNELELASSLGSLSATGNVTAAEAALTAGQDIALGQDLVVDGALIVGAGGNISVLGNTDAASVDATAGGDIGFNSVLSGGPTTLHSDGGSIVVDALDSSGLVTASAAQSIEINGTGSLSFATAAAGGDLYVHTTGDLVLPATSAGGNIDLASQDGDLDVNGSLQGGSTTLASGGDTHIGGNLNATSLRASAGGSFVVQGLADVGNAQVSGAGGVAFPSLISDGFVSLSSTSGAIVVSELVAGGEVNADGQSVDISSSGSLDFGSVFANNGNVELLTAGDLSAFNIYATGTATLDAGGTFALTGGLVGTEIRVSSADIAIDGGEGFIGQHGVTSLISLLNADPTRTTYIGGGSQRGGYSLDEDEARLLFADEHIRLGVANADLPSQQGLVEVGDLELTFEPEGNIGSGGTIEISSPTEVLFNGNVQITTVSAGDTLLIDPAFVGIDTTAGQINLSNSNGTATGSLHIIGDTVAAATTDLLALLRGPGEIGAITALLDTPGGSGEPLTAGSISVTVTNGLYIQNTGASTEFDDRRGFSTGSLSIETSGPQTQIAINGVTVDANGTPVTGLNTTPLVTINDIPAAAGGQFDPGSTINGCIIGTACAFVPEPQRPPEPPASDDLNPVNPADPEAGGLIAPLIELAGTNPLIEPPLVDEPITGVGNDDLWEPPCQEEAEDGICRGGSEQQ